MTIEQEPKEAEPLSDNEVFRLLAAIGNSPAKALTLVAMEKGTIYHQYALGKRLRTLQGGSRVTETEESGWNIAIATPWSWCEGSLGPIGLVAQEIIDYDLKTIGYIRTEYGQKVGTLQGSTLRGSARLRGHPSSKLEGIRQVEIKCMKQLLTM